MEVDGQPVRKLSEGNPWGSQPLEPSVGGKQPTAQPYPSLPLATHASTSAAIITYICFPNFFFTFISALSILLLFSQITVQRGEYGSVSAKPSISFAPSRVKEIFESLSWAAGCWLSEGISSQRTKHLSPPCWAPYYLLAVGHICFQISLLGFSLHISFKADLLSK